MLSLRFLVLVKASCHVMRLMWLGTEASVKSHVSELKMKVGPPAVGQSPGDCNLERDPGLEPPAPLLLDFQCSGDTINVSCFEAAKFGSVLLYSS